MLVGDIPPAQAARVDGEVATAEAAGVEHDLLVVGRGLAPRVPEHWSGRATVLGESGPLAMVRSVRNWITRTRPDVLHVHGVWAVLLSALARRGLDERPTLLYEVHGALAFEALKRHRGPTKVPRFAFLYLLENVGLLAADRVLLVSEQIRRYYPWARGIPGVAIPRVVTVDEYASGGSAEVADVLEFVGRCRAAGRRVVVYSGGTGRWQQLEKTLQVLQRSVDRGSAGLILTYDPEGMTRALSREMVESPWIKVDSLSRGVVQHALRACDVGLLLRDSSVVNRVASPTKFFEYLAAGLHVVTTPGAEAIAGIVAGHRVGLLVDLEEAPDIVADWVPTVDRSREEVARLRDLVEARYTWTARREDLLALYE